MLKYLLITQYFSSGHSIGHKALITGHIQERGVMDTTSRWNYIKSYGTMIGLGELHSCHRGLGKTRHAATWSVVSVCLWRKCGRHDGAERLICWRLEEGGTHQQTTLNEAVISFTLNPLNSFSSSDDYIWAFRPETTKPFSGKTTQGGCVGVGVLLQIPSRQLNLIQVE